MSIADYIPMCPVLEELVSNVESKNYAGNQTKPGLMERKATTARNDISVEHLTW